MQRTKKYELDLDSTRLYGIEIKPTQSLQDIKEAWSHRTVDTYTLLPFIPERSSSLWRSIKTGKLMLWDDSMLSSTNKKGIPVVDSYIWQDNLAPIDFFKLSLEYLAAKSSILINYNGKNKTDPLIIVKDIYNEITLNIKLEKKESSLNAVKYYEYLTNVINFLKENLVIDSVETQYIKELEGRSRFWELNNTLQYSDWAANCLAIYEIENSELFRFEYKSLKEYVTKSETLDFNYDEYLRRSKAGGVVKFLSESKKKLPLNKSQAIALAEIPRENMLVVWDKFLEQPGRKSVKLISEIHEEILFGQKKEALIILDLEQVKQTIQILLQKEILPDTIRVLLEMILSQELISPLEAKLVKTIKTFIKKND